MDFDLSQYLIEKTDHYFDIILRDNIKFLKDYDIKKRFDEETFMPYYKVKFYLLGDNVSKLDIKFKTMTMKEITTTKLGKGISMDDIDEYKKYLDRIINLNKLL
jgi:hypothetical protein